MTKNVLATRQETPADDFDPETATLVELIERLSPNTKKALAVFVQLVRVGAVDKESLTPVELDRQLDILIAHYENGGL